MARLIFRTIQEAVLLRQSSHGELRCQPYDDSQANATVSWSVYTERYHTLIDIVDNCAQSSLKFEACLCGHLCTIMPS